MGLGNSIPIQQVMTLRQTNEPGNPVEGMTWVDTSGNNVERKQWNGSQWELDVAVGPDDPDHAVEGARWSKTDEATVLVYDGSTWQGIGVTDHANLSNVTANQHHPKQSIVLPIVADKETVANGNTFPLAGEFSLSNWSMYSSIDVHLSSKNANGGDCDFEIRDGSGNTVHSWGSVSNDLRDTINPPSDGTTWQWFYTEDSLYSARINVSMVIQP